jgi:hypothetical protein
VDEGGKIVLFVPPALSLSLNLRWATDARGGYQRIFCTPLLFLPISRDSSAHPLLHYLSITEPSSVTIYQLAACLESDSIGST